MRSFFLDDGTGPIAARNRADPGGEGSAGEPPAGEAQASERQAGKSPVVDSQRSNFDADTSTFAHAGRPDMGASASRAKAPRGHTTPLLVSRADGVSSLSAERILNGLRGTNVCMAYQDRDLVYSWIANPPDGFEEITGRRDPDIMAPEAARLLTEAKRRCLATGEGTKLTINAGNERSMRWFDVWIEPDFARPPQPVRLAPDATPLDTGGSRDADPEASPDADPDVAAVLVPAPPAPPDEIEGIIIVGIEVTERVEHEDRLRVLLREVSHRSRNLLAIVQSIAAQTVRAGAPPGRFLDRFNQRLQSLAHTLDLVTLREWEGATLHQLVSRQARPFRPRNGSIEIGGPDPVLTPNAALHLGLGVQELASNAVNHGAWSRPDGRVEARTRMSKDGQTLVFEWLETGAGAAQSDVSSAFGSRTLMSIVPAALGGEASMVAEANGFAYRLRVPPANFDV